MGRVADDPQLRAVLEVARAWGVSPRRFLGWEPTRTVCEYDGAGQVVRTLTVTTEAEWDEESRGFALELAAWEADLCPGCRQPLSETSAAQHEEGFVAEPAIRCHRCTASEQAAVRYKDVPQAGALLIPVVPRPAEP